MHCKKIHEIIVFIEGSIKAPRFSFGSSLTALVEVVAGNRNAAQSQVKKVQAPRFEKKTRQKISDYLKQMATPEIEAQLAPLRAAVKEYGDLIRDLKAKSAPKIDIDKAVVELKARKRLLEETEISLAPKEASFDRLKLEDLLKRRFFYDQSFAIYGGVTGLYDFGPMGCSLKANMLQEWRKHFILEEGMLEVDCTSLTPEPVLKASGHVDRFADWMVKDVKNGECFRADHLIKNSIEKLMNDKKVSADVKRDGEDVLARLEGFDDKDMHEVITRFKFKSPITGNDLTEPIAFNLMFPTQIGPTGDFKAFLRPETAQGIFVNFKRLLEFNQGKLPFAAAQIGLGFRNEISPRQGLIRVREFTMCEIEHFVDPEDKSFPKFSKIADQKLVLFPHVINWMEHQRRKSPSEMLLQTKMTIYIMFQKTVANETLGYYMARCHQFLMKVGIDGRRLRFRQHLSNEMAHYAQDCWDAEILTSYGWIECVGNADRACYDLLQHYKATNVKLVAEKKLPQPVDVDIVEAQANMALLGKSFKKEAKKIQSALQQMTSEQVTSLEADLLSKKLFNLNINGEAYPLTPDLINIKKYSKKIHVQEITPSVIEPSYGIGRIMYALLEHSFRQREGDEQRTFLAFKPLVAPIKCSVLPISANDQLVAGIEAVKEELSRYELSYKVDDSSGTIGRRYARTDEIGIPFGITVDFESVKTTPYTVTIRHAETMSQIRLEVSELGRLISDLVAGRQQWTDAQAKYPKFESTTD
uniref:Glycine--tRNA ligase n=2 Tax=Caenorhabditis tropicalis TaxID=1561998 RepID=A0A1I7TWM9_9PELO